MKKMIQLFTISALVLWAMPVLAQSTWFGVQGSAVLPTGDLNEVTTSGGGGAVHLDQNLSGSIQARVDAGWLQFSSRDMVDGFTSKARVIPVRAGLSWNFGPASGTRFYIGGMAGVYFREISTEINDEGSADEDSFFGAAATAGMLIPISAHGGMLEINFSYDLWFDDVDGDGNDLDMGLVRMGVGYRFNI